METNVRDRTWARGKRIGRGSFGIVDLAVRRSDGGVFAVKSVELAGGSPSEVESLENEIRILQSLTSPYVVKYLGDDVTLELPRTTPFRNLHLEYLPGGTVADVGTVDERFLRSYVSCAVSALKYVHSRGIVHCDVKGKNVLLSHVRGTCKLADFGSAMEISNNRRDVPILPRGSPLWMAPEVVRREYQGPESDIWSLGCTIVEMITGKPAWIDEGIGTLRRIGFSDDLPEFPTQLSEAGRDFLHKCIRRERSERWSCDELLHHPFLQSTSSNTIIDTSPRCVLDFFSSDSSDIEEKEEEERILSVEINTEESEISARGRVGKLACNREVNFESEGWIVVRELDSNSLETSNREGTSSEYMAMAVTGITCSRNSYTMASNSVRDDREVPELQNFSGGVQWCEIAPICRHGLENMDLTADNEDNGFYGCCQLIHEYLYLITHRFLLIFQFIIYVFSSKIRPMPIIKKMLEWFSLD